VIDGERSKDAVAADVYAAIRGALPAPGA